MGESVGLYSTCLVSMMRPGVGLAAVELLRQAGVDPVVPDSQTCCGQPALNAGLRTEAKRLVRKCAAEFASCDAVVVPSGSCAGTLRTHMPSLFAAGEPGADEAAALAAKCTELATFLAARGFVPEQAANPLRIAYHDSCAGLRELGIKQQPRRLLESAGHELIDLAEAETCCGFGGSFAVKFGALSSHMADCKCDAAEASGAEVLALGDVGCLLNIEGRMMRRGGSMRIAHFAELLAPSAAAA